MARCQQVVYAMWDYRIRNAPQAGPTELIRESEGYGLGNGASRENRITRELWFFGTSDPSLGGLPNPLGESGGPNDEDWTIHLVVDGPEPIPDAVVADGVPLEPAIDDIVLRDQSDQVIPFNQTSMSYQIFIPAGTERGDAATRVRIDAPAPGSGDGDAPLEETRLVIDRVTTSATPSWITVLPGWNDRSRYLFEDGNGGTGELSIGVDCSAIMCPPIDCANASIASDPRSLVLQIGHATPETAQATIGTTCPGTGTSGHCQKSTKVIAEEKMSPTNMGEFGLRFKDRDTQSLIHGVCGCNLTSTSSEITVRFTITGGTARVDDDPAQVPTANEDFGLFYCPQGWFFGNQTPLVVSGAGVGTGTFDVTLTAGDNPKCMGLSPPGFGLCILTYTNDDGAGTEWEDVEIRVDNVWVGAPSDGMPMYTPHGWNNSLRWIIEEGQ
ncbi:MAG: hypothetical protein GY725_10850 [bacterium]|nr:hypothetical protein [bacterium]